MKTRIAICCLLLWAALQTTAQTNVSKVSSCKASQLSANEDRKESEEMDGGAGNQALTISIQNRSPSPCVLQGIPALTLLDSSSRPLSTHICANCGDYLFPKQPLKTIFLETNKSAYVLVGYRTECMKADLPTFHLSTRQGSLNIAVAGWSPPIWKDGLQSCLAVNITPFLEKPPVEGSLPPEN
jgi:hypothetical protein